jgi:hypothetical protein
MWLLEKGWLSFRLGPVKRPNESGATAVEAQDGDRLELDVCGFNRVLTITRSVLRYLTRQFVLWLPLCGAVSGAVVAQSTDGHPVHSPTTSTAASIKTTISIQIIPRRFRPLRPHRLHFSRVTHSFLVQGTSRIVYSGSKNLSSPASVLFESARVQLVWQPYQKQVQ